MLLFSSPLHSLRKTFAFRLLIKSRWNKPRLFRLGFEHKVALRPFTHASIFLGRNKLEPGIRSLILKICKELTQDKKEHFFFDVGANIGLYTWEVAKICPDLKIMVFEPDPNNIELLQITNGLTGSDRIKLCSFALSNKCQETAFEQDYLTSATGSIASGNQSWIEKYLNGTPNKIKIQTRTLDQISGKSKLPTLVKIDVEGHENEVLEGGMRTIQKSKPVIIVESFPPKQSKVTMTLKTIGYNIFDADSICPVREDTVNLFAWHPKGPIKNSFVQNILDS